MNLDYPLPPARKEEIVSTKGQGGGEDRVPSRQGGKGLVPAVRVSGEGGGVMIQTSA